MHARSRTGTRRSSFRRLAVAAVAVLSTTAMAGVLSATPAQAAPGQVTVYSYYGNGPHKANAYWFGPKFTMHLQVYSCASGATFHTKLTAWDTRTVDNSQPPPGLHYPWWSTSETNNGTQSKYSAARQHLTYRITADYDSGTVVRCKYHVWVTEYRANAPG